METKCYNKKCLHEWDYKGENKKFVCCPKCRFKRILSKCRSFYLEEHTKNDRPTNILSDRPTNIPLNITPKLNIVKEKPNKSESYQKEEIKEVDNLADFNLAVLDNRLKNKSKGILEVRGSPEESPSGIKLCEEHKQSARYDSYYNKWVCRNCIQEKIDNPIKRKVILLRG